MPFTLITSATSSQAHKIKNRLGDTPIILGDHADLPDFMLKAGKMLQLPNPASASYSHQMLTLCLDNDIDTIYPLQNDEAKLLLEAEQLFKEYDITIVVSGE